MLITLSTSFQLFLFVLSISTFTVIADDCGCLKLTPFIKNGSTTLARKVSMVDPANFLNVTSHTGFITVNEEYDSNIFFWYFPHKLAAERPWIIWLQGGPGFSSLLGLFEIIGPFKVEEGKMTLRNITWAKDYSILFVDQPVGAGFSFTNNVNGYTTNEDQVGEQLYEFLVQFLEVFPELRKAPLFIAGESYAGKYVPALGIQIHRHRNSNVAINLRGLSIGNGLIDPTTQMNYGYLCAALGLVEGEDLIKLNKMDQDAVRYIDEGRMIDAANKFNETIEFTKKVSGVDIYNFNEVPSSKPHAFEGFVNRPEVRKRIHVGNVTFYLNNQLVYQNMLGDIMNSTKPFLQELLENYGVLSYSGQLDVILPYALSKQMYASLEWSRRDEYHHAIRKHMSLTPGGPVIGYKKAGGNFEEVLIRLAGHMVPKDQPKSAKLMIDSFIDKYK